LVTLGTGKTSIQSATASVGLSAAGNRSHAASDWTKTLFFIHAAAAVCSRNPPARRSRRLQLFSPRCAVEEVRGDATKVSPTKLIVDLSPARAHGAQPSAWSGGAAAGYRAGPRRPAVARPESRRRCAPLSSIDVKIALFSRSRS